MLLSPGEREFTSGMFRGVDPVLSPPGFHGQRASAGRRGVLLLRGLRSSTPCCSRHLGRRRRGGAGWDWAAYAQRQRCAPGRHAVVLRRARGGEHGPRGGSSAGDGDGFSAVTCST
ncbi:hypothetical protein HBB16_09790 [Pseudonocardia sp. MCCB 268]|nr:hypothetical protein [Pseudonocardia cytotoxica]